MVSMWCSSKTIQLFVWRLIDATFWFNETDPSAGIWYCDCLPITRSPLLSSTIFVSHNPVSACDIYGYKISLSYNFSSTVVLVSGEWLIKLNNLSHGFVESLGGIEFYSWVIRWFFFPTVRWHGWQSLCDGSCDYVSKSHDQFPTVMWHFDGVQKSDYVMIM